MKKISSHTFKHTIRDIHNNTQNRKFCFVMGAGTSYASGIPTGGHLAKKWYEEIKERYPSEELREWSRAIKLDEKDLAAQYGSIYRKRFEIDKNSGYEFLVQAMKPARPTFGHFILAQILTKAPGNCVLTTNFDSLIESAIYQFTERTPLVCGHESLSGFARPSNIHPLIIKIHRDLLLSPKSDSEEINELDEGWKEPLDNIFRSHIPIVIGYGGNDGSLMGYLEKMDKPSNFFWCGLKGDAPSSRIKNLVGQMHGTYVEIDGFDEIMHELLWVFDKIRPIKEELDAITKTRIETMDTQMALLDNRMKLATASKSTSKKELSAFEYAKMAEKEPDFEKRKSIYLEALEKFPETGWLWNDFTYFLQFVKKDYSDLEEYYRKALSIDPNNENNNGNYAIFLHTIKKDYNNADRQYLKSLSKYPENAVLNGDYANFLDLIKGDYVNAEKYYQIALSIDPESPNVNGNYAVLLKNYKKDFKEAERYFLRSLAFDPESANKNGNYGQFLLEMNRAIEAQPYLEKALLLNMGKRNDLALELAFYQYALDFDSINESEKVLDELLKEEISSIGWIFDGIISIAIKKGHPNPKGLEEFSRRISRKDS